MNLYVCQFTMILNNVQGICYILHNYNSIVGNFVSKVDMFLCLNTVLRILSCIMFLTNLTVGVHIVVFP